MSDELRRPSADFLARARERIRQMQEAARETTKALGLPAEAAYDVLEVMVGGQDVTVGAPRRTVARGQEHGKPVALLDQHRTGRPPEALKIEAALEEYRVIVDATLQRLYRHMFVATTELYPRSLAQLSLSQLHEGPVGQALFRLARVAAGAHRADREDVLEAIDSVLQLLFWPVGSDTYTVPPSFWEQPLGMMLSLAKLRSFEPSDLVSIGNAANILNVTRPTIYRWMDDKSLDYVRDDMSGRTFVVRQDVEAMKADIEAHESATRGVEAMKPGISH